MVPGAHRHIQDAAFDRLGSHAGFLQLAEADVDRAVIGILVVIDGDVIHAHGIFLGRRRCIGQPHRVAVVFDAAGLVPAGFLRDRRRHPGMSERQEASLQGKPANRRCRDGGASQHGAFHDCALLTDLFAPEPARGISNSDMVFSPVFLCSCHDRRGDSCPATDVSRASRKLRLRTKPALRRQ
jgi:hypothetical protein